MSLLEVIEEWRFLFELLAAMLVFTLPTRTLKKDTLLRFFLCLVPLMGLSVLYFFIKELGTWLANTIFQSGYAFTISRILLFGGWYILMLTLILLSVQWVFRIPAKDLIFIALAGYALQHIVFVLVHELLAQAIWPHLVQSIPLYLAITICATTLIYSPVYHYFKPEMKRHDRGNLVKSAASQKAYRVMLVLLILQAFAGQHIFNNSLGSARYITSLFSVSLCLLILYAQFVTLHAANLVEEQFILEQLFYERKMQYQIEKEAIDHLNHRVHDFKNQILALTTLDDVEKNAFYQEILQQITDYDHVLNLENESLNTLLTQKYHYCQRNHIQLTHMIDSQCLYFIKAIDLYAILGNALDNAIECVQQYEIEEDRQISLHIKRHKQFVHMEISNRLLSELEMSSENPFPVSHKKDHRAHGFGLKSIQATVEKYKGWLSINSQPPQFILTILIPIPEK